ncbi:MAG: OmpA family protein [Gammaproteobacteria bacterium]
MVLSTNRGVIVLLGVCTQVLLTAIFLWRVEPYIEGRLERSSKQALQEANYTWARVEADGRDLKVSGMAPNARMKARAAQLVDGVEGVRIVKDELLVASAKAPTLAPEEADRRARELLEDIESDAPVFALDLPYELHFSVEATVLTMSGLVPDDIAKASLLNLANREFGDGRVIDRLMVAPGAPDNFLAAATRAITGAGEIGKGLVMVTDNEVIVQGLSSTSQATNRLQNALAELPPGYSANIQIGDQRELEALLRTHPSLAQRVGSVNSQPRDETVIKTVRIPVESPVANSADSAPAPTSDSRSTEPSFEPQTQVAQVTQSIDPTECAYQLQAQLTRQAIGFDTGSSDISSNSEPLMRELVRISKQCPRAVLEIGGHTDDLGTRENNLSLSQRRAEAVMEFMVRNGVSLSRLRAVGYGEERPRVENTTAERRKQNRRIEFSLVDES